MRNNCTESLINFHSLKFNIYIYIYIPFEIASNVLRLDNMVIGCFLSIFVLPVRLHVSLLPPSSSKKSIFYNIDAYDSGWRYKSRDISTEIERDIKRDREKECVSEKCR